MQKMAVAEKVKIINKLILQANKDYSDWQYSYQKMMLFLYHRLSMDPLKWA
jgi:hypothetical protein